MATKTKQQIRKEIGRLEDARDKDYKKINGKYEKAVDNLWKAEDREEKKHPEKFFEIAKKYQPKIQKVMAQWHRASNAVHAKYKARLEKLYNELISAK